MNQYYDHRGLAIPEDRIKEQLADCGKTEAEVRQFLGEHADSPGFFIDILNTLQSMQQWAKAKHGRGAA